MREKPDTALNPADARDVLLLAAGERAESSEQERSPANSLSSIGLEPFFVLFALYDRSRKAYDKRKRRAGTLCRKRNGIVQAVSALATLEHERGVARRRRKSRRLWRD